MGRRGREKEGGNSSAKDEIKESVSESVEEHHKASAGNRRKRKERSPRSRDGAREKRKSTDVDAPDKEAHEGAVEESIRGRHALQEARHHSPPVEQGPFSPQLEQRGGVVYDHHNLPDSSLRTRPYSWVRYRASTEGDTMRMTVDALFAEFDQTHERLNTSNVCALAALKVAKWAVLHPEHPAPSEENLENILVDAALEAEADQWLARAVRRSLSEIWQLQEYVPGVALASSHSGCLTVDGESPPPEECRFHQVWQRHVVGGPRHGGAAAYVLGYDRHFFVVRVDQKGNYYVVDSGGWYMGVERAFVLSFGPGTSFDERPIVYGGDPSDSTFLHTTNLSSSAACEKYVADFLGRTNINRTGSPSTCGTWFPQQVDIWPVGLA